MKILIVETVWMGGSNYRFLDKVLLTAFSILPTLQARELAAITPKNHSLSLINERYSSIDYNDTYDVVLINYVTATAPRAYEIADTFRKKDVLVVLSGFHASGLPFEAKQHADSVLIGRNESIWPSVIHDIEQKKLQPYYHAAPYTSTTKLPATNINLPGFMMTTPLEATRGCPYQCEFCPESSIPGGSSFYKRPIDEVITEIKTIPQKILMFYDTSLTIDPTYTKELFREMKGLNKKFFCNGNVDVLANDPEFVQLSKQAGCIAWLIGFESVSQITLDAVGKTTNSVDIYRKAVQNIHKNRMVVIGDFMFGFDTDSPEVFQQTLLEIHKLQIDVADFSILTPFPGTPLFQHLKEQERILTEDWKYYNMGNVVFRPQQMSPQELQNGVRMMYQKFYSLPSTIRRILRGLRLGVYPFGVIVARNLVATMSARRLSPVKKES